MKHALTAGTIVILLLVSLTQSLSHIYAQGIGSAISQGLGLSKQAPTVCEYLPEGSRGGCDSCLAGGDTFTAIGCIDSSSTSDFIAKMLKIALGMGGGIAFLLILFGGFQIMTSTGNPEKLQAGQELISGAVAGLMMILFSVFLLKLIGVDILGLPEWQ